MTRSSTVLMRLAGACLLSPIISVPAAATTIPIIGGDPGDGYAPLGTTFAAVNLGAASAFTVQGVTFAASSPNVSLSPVGTSNENVAPFGASVDDINLLTVVQS